MNYTDKEIRAWAVENRLNVGKRGRLSSDVKAKWQAFIQSAADYDAALEAEND